MLVRKHKIRPFNMVVRSGGPGAVLARLFRTVMFDLGITENDRYDSMMARYIQKARLLPDAAKQEAARIGLSKELLKESITWKTFLKGLEFLYVKQVDFSLTLERNGALSEHSHSFLLGSREQPGKHLAVLLGIIFHELDIRGDEYSQLTDAYIERSRTIVHKRQRATIRASISKELLKTVMTWKTFLKGLSFIGVQRFTISIRLHHTVKKLSMHTVQVSLDGEIGDEDGNDE